MNVNILSVAEERVMWLRAQGLTGAEVAHRLGISEQTVKKHQSAVYLKLDVDNLVEAMRALGWVHVPGTEPQVTTRCDYLAQCGRAANHRGHHGGFREVPS